MRTFSFSMITFAVTGDAQLAGLVTTVGGVVFLVCQIPGGVIVDRFNRKKAIILAAILRTLVTATAVVLWLTGLVNIYLLLAVSVLTAMIAGLFGSASNAALKQIVDPQDFSRANSANQSRDALINMASGPISGFLMAIYLWFPFAINAILSALAAGIATVIKRDLSPYTNGESRQKNTFWIDLMIGFRFIKTNRSLLVMVVAASLMNFAGMTMVSAVILGMQADNVPFWAIGVITALPSFGMITMAIITAKRSDNWRIGRTIIVTLTLATLCATPLIFTMHPLVVVGCALVLFSVLVPANVVLNGFTMTIVPNRLQARVNSVMMFGSTGLSAFSPAIAGYLIKFYTPGVAVLSGIAIMAATVILVAGSTSVRNLGPRNTLKYVE